MKVATSGEGRESSNFEKEIRSSLRYFVGHHLCEASWARNNFRAHYRATLARSLSVFDGPLVGTEDLPGKYRSYPRSSTVFPFIFYRSANRIAPLRSVLGGNHGNVKVEGLVWPSSACSTEMKIHMSLVKVPSFLLPELQSEVVGMSQIMKRISPFPLQGEPGGEERAEHNSP